MAALFDIILIGFIGYAVWLLRLYVKESIEFKHAKRTEIKRRLQVEAKNEAALDIRLRAEKDEITRMELMLEASRERSRRQVAYVIQDVYESNK